MTLKTFTIFGERNSGTTYLENLLRKMLRLRFTGEYGFKHWYIKDMEPRGAPNTTTDNECIQSLDDSDETLFIVIVRNVYDWVGSMYQKPYHMKHINKQSLLTFVSSPYLAYESTCPPDHGPQSRTRWTKNTSHRHPFFMEEADHLIDLRNKKNRHFHHLQTKVKHYYIIRQEHLKKDIKEMIKTFQLDYSLVDLPTYKKPKSYNLPKEVVDFIDQHLDNPIDS
jgi:hypothetical protein